MIFRRSIYLATSVCLVGCLFGPFYVVTMAGTEVDSEFRDVLELTGIGAETLAEVSDGPDYTIEDWKLFVQLFSRIGQYPTALIESWAKPWDGEAEQKIGNLYEMSGEVVSLEILNLPEEFSHLQKQSKLYRCQVLVDVFDIELVVLSLQVPKRWGKRDLSAGEPVRFRGILLKAKGQHQRVMLTDRFAWYPCKNVPTGQALLARNGMDVSLLDEVIHRQPFVKPTVSRESDAFYACLTAIKQVTGKELATLAQENVVLAAEKWRKLRDSSAKQAEKKSIQLAIASAVFERSKVGVSSVAPLFLQPEQEVGELVRLEGTARRAIWIAETERPKLKGYYELEVFPPDSQDIPVVCCATNLPPGFPIGDKIREPVRISGVFFKSWLYRSRKLISTNGETKRQQRLYTPIVVTGSPTWLTDTQTRRSPWGLWGGVAFLAVLVILWINMLRRGRRDRLARSTSLPSQVQEKTP